jgi:hypothetical protein
VDFGDFRWFRLEEIKGGRFIGGFGRIATVRLLQGWYRAAPPPLHA